MVRFNILSISNGLSLDLPSCNIQQKLHLWDFHNNWNQRFIIEECIDDAGYYHIFVDNDSNGKLLVSLLPPFNEGCELLLLPYMNNNDSQKFQFIETSSGSIIQCKLNDLVLDVENFNMDNGARVIMWRSTSGNNQLWKICITSDVQFPFLTNLDNHSIDISRLSELRSKLEDNGFCIVKNVFNKTDLIEAKANIGNDLLELVDVNFIMNDVNLTHEYENYLRMPKDKIIDEWKISGQNFIDKHCLPQGSFASNIRLSSKIRAIFETIYSEKDLVVGLDCIFWKSGTEISNNPAVGLWGHADQNIKRDDSESWDCFQSVIAIFDLKDDQAEATVVWPQSHKNVYPTLLDAANKDFSHYIELSILNDAQFYDVVKGRHLNYKFVKESRRVPMSAGDMLVWNSKCIHQGYSNNGRRLAMPICFEPRGRRSNKAFITKVKLSIMGYASTHWASLVSRHGKYLKHIDNHIEGRKYRYFSSDGQEINFPIKNGLIPFIIKDEYRNDYERILDLARQIGNDDIKNEEILAELRPMLKEIILEIL